MATVRAALIQTVNAYAGMPESKAGLPALKDKLEDIRRANVEHNLRLIEKAAKRGAQAVCLGELFPMPYFAFEEDPMWLAAAEDAADGPTVRELREAAKRLSVLLVAPIYELDAGTGKRYDTAVVLDERGAILGKYRKTHIPRGTNEQGRFVETFFYGRADSKPYFPVFETSLGKIGVDICYDRHFEGVVRRLAKNGAEIIFSPAVTFGDKSRRMWEHEFLVDASRHRVFIGGINRLGKEKPWNQEFFGASHFAGPDGEKLADLSDDPAIVLAELDMDVLRRPDPSGWNLPRDERPDIYVS